MENNFIDKGCPPKTPHSRVTLELTVCRKDETSSQCSADRNEYCVSVCVCNAKQIALARYVVVVVVVGHVVVRVSTLHAFMEVNQCDAKKKPKERHNLLLFVYTL